MVLALLAGGAIILGTTGAGWRLGSALAGIGFVAWVGWLDDRRSLQVGPRLVAHVASAAAALPLAATLPGAGGPAAGFVLAWWLFWGVSAINVVNFMDGIDGLIGSQMAVFGIHLALVGGQRPDTLLYAAALCGSALGFLWWNWAPARIFLGDSGSGALGLAAAVGGILVLRDGSGLVTTFLPLYPIFLDATLTLAARARRRERITQAHRSHLYQRLANGGWGHARVTLAYGAAAALAVVAAVSPVPYQRPVIAAYLVIVTLTGLALSRFADGVPVRSGIG